LIAFWKSAISDAIPFSLFLLQCQYSQKHADERNVIVKIEMELPPNLELLTCFFHQICVNNAAAKKGESYQQLSLKAGWSCWLRDTKMTTDPMLNIAVHDIHQGPMKAWLSRDDHFQMSMEGFDLVDWWAVHRSMDKFPEVFCLWSSKHVSHFCGVG
jgi:hypothetical protein